MKCPFCIKKCGKCGELLVAWSGNFNKLKSGKYGLGSQCKICRTKYHQQYSKKYYKEHREEILEKKKQYNEEHKEEKAEYDKQYREEHKEEIAEKSKQYYEEHREGKLEKQKQYYEEHREERTEYARQYHINNPHIKFNSHNKRRQLEENQGRGITKEQWKEMFDFFEWKCAYSGIDLKEGINRSIDHIDCLDNGGLNEIWNVVPMHMPYNSSKHNSEDMLDWYKKQPFFSEERLNKIYEWVEYAWNKWGYETESEIVFNYCDLNDETIERYFEEELEEII